MLYKTILWFVIIVIFTPLSAQPQFSDFRVNFNADEYLLDAPDIEILNKVIDEAKAGGYYEITLSAHTDNDGSDNYNLILSNKRAMAVRNYLVTNGLVANVMDIDWYGERKPETTNAAPEGKSVNRRVVVTLKKYDLEDVQDVLKTSGGNYTQTFTFNSETDNRITAGNGTSFLIPKNVLMTKDGTPVNAADITLEVQEFQTSGDAIFNGMSTFSEGRILQTGGMFNVVAKYKGEELKLKEGSAIQIEMPSANIKDDMEVFVGVKNKEGVTEWKPTAQPFIVKPKKKIDYPSVRLDVAYLKQLKQDIRINNLEVLESRYILPKAVQRPQMPNQPKLKEYPDEANFFTKRDRLLKSRSKREKMLAREYAVIDEYNNKKMERYEQNMELYNMLSSRFPQDSIHYLSEQQKFHDWLNVQLENCKKEIIELEKAGFNRALAKLIEASNNDMIKESVTMKNLSSQITYGKEERERLLELYHLEFLFSTVVDMEYKNIVEEYSRNGLFVMDYSSPNNTRGLTYNDNPDYRLATNSFAENLFRNDQKLKEVFAAANFELLNKRSKMGLTDFNTLNSIYSASISGFGSINCDRFDQTPPEQMVDVEIECEGRTQISFFLPSINSYIYANKNTLSNKYQVRLPAGTNATMVVVGLEGGVPVFQKQKLQIKPRMSVLANPLPATLKQIHSEVASI